MPSMTHVFSVLSYFPAFSFLSECESKVRKLLVTLNIEIRISTSHCETLIWKMVVILAYFIFHVTILFVFTSITYVMYDYEYENM